VHIIAFMNQKGGVGKTTTVVNLGALLARAGKRVLIVDCDPQANASSHLGIDIYGEHPTLYSVLRAEATISEARQEIDEGLWIIPSELDLAGVDMELASAVGRETILRHALADHVRGGHTYDYVLCDCPPSLGLLPLNALAASGEVAIVLQAEFFALQGIAGLTRFVDLVTDKINPGLITSTVVLCMVDSRTRFGREVVDEITGYFGDKVFDTSIRRNIKLAEATSQGMAVIDWDPGCPGSQDYIALTLEFLQRHHDEPDPESPLARHMSGARRMTRRSSRVGGVSPAIGTGEESDPDVAPPPVSEASPAEASPAEATTSEDPGESPKTTAADERAADERAADERAADERAPGTPPSTTPSRQQTDSLTLRSEDELLRR
jgi:chromosome partitioning protein